jgi:membrane protein YdbS with pleckstrin-like domain
MPGTTAANIPVWKRLLVGVCVLASAVPLILWTPLPWPLLWPAAAVVVVWFLDRLLGLPKGWYWPNWREQTRAK